MKSHSFCHFRDTQFALVEKLLCVFNTTFCQKGTVGFAKCFFEHPAKVCVAVSTQLCHIPERNIFGVKLFNIRMGYTDLITGKKVTAVFCSNESHQKARSFLSEFGYGPCLEGGLDHVNQPLGQVVCIHSQPDAVLCHL